MVDASRTWSEQRRIGRKMVLAAVESARLLCLLQAQLSTVAKGLLLVFSANPIHLGHHSWQVRLHWFEARQARWRRKM